MSKVLIIDGNNRLYASYFAYDGLSHNGKPTNCVYGMLEVVKATIKEVNPDITIIAWDGRYGKRIRRTIFSGYKKRQKDSGLLDLEDLIRQKKILFKLFTCLGVNQVICDKLEGDDVIAALVNKFKNHKIIINSADKDFNQLLKKGVIIYRQLKENIYVSYKNCKDLFGYSPEETIDFLSIVGDKSDNIPGVKGAGEKTARALLDKYGSISNFLNSNDEFPRIYRDELLRAYNLNRKLIDLGLFHRDYVKGKIKLSLIGNRNPKMQEKTFFSLCTKYGINSLRDRNFTKTFKQHSGTI